MNLILFLIISILTILLVRYNNEKKENYKTYLYKRKREADAEITRAIAEKKAEQEQLDSSIQSSRRELGVYQELVKDSQYQHEVLKQSLQDFEESGKKQIEDSLQAIKKEKIENMEMQIAADTQRQKEKAEADYLNYLLTIKGQRELAEAELSALKLEVEEYRAKQEAINQEILRQRELENQTDFYRVCLSEEAIADITLLQITRQKLKKPEIIDKIIYDTYIAKPVLEMIKRVLQNTTCSGIYKITCLETKEIYIGKSTDIKNRWQQHCKTAFNCGTIASSVLHRKMQQYGIEKFTFELLEKVPKDQLTEREKFYIDFYKTKETGLNERNG